MTIGEFSMILEKLKGQTEFIYYHLMGEPLTHPLLPEFIKKAGENGYKSIITTNGTLLKKRGAELLNAGVHKVNISLHSFESGGEEERGEYIKALAEFAVAAASRGAIAVFRLWNKGCDDGQNDALLQQLRLYIPGEWAENSRGLKLRDKVFLEYGERFQWPDTNAEIAGNRFFCYGLKDQFGILADGSVVPCCLDSEGTICLGNIFKENINDILGSQRAQDIVDGFKRGTASEELCRRCEYAQRFV